MKTFFMRVFSVTPLEIFGILIFTIFVGGGCTTVKVQKFVDPCGVRFCGEQVREKIMSSCVVRQKRSPLLWENAGRYCVAERAKWWRENACGERVTLKGSGRLDDLCVTLYPMHGTNGWLGVGSSPGRGTVLVSLIDDVVGKVVVGQIRLREYESERRIFQAFFPGGELPIPLKPEYAEKIYDPFLFDGNKRLMYRTFNPDEQYYEYDALRENLRPVSADRVRDVKRTYRDLMRIPLSSGFVYWDKDDRGQLRPNNTYYRLMDPVADAVPPWTP